MADIELAFEQHMSDAEALMWNIEKDPALSSWFASITILEKPADHQAMRDMVAAAVALIPRLRQRVSPNVGRFSPPMWVDDPEFDLDFHIRRVGLPRRAKMDDLDELCVKLLLDPFERTRPLWQYVLIDGLPGGKGAVFQKMHHTITDGEGGMKLAEMMLALDEGTSDIEVPEWEPAPRDADFGDSLGETIGHNIRRFGGMAQRAITGLVTDPQGAIQNVTEVVTALGELTGPSDTGDDAPVVGSPIWQPRTLKRWYGRIDVDFRPFKYSAKERGGTINDLFVAGALAGTAAYHEARDSLPDAFNVAMPVSHRQGGSAGGNQFALTQTALPAISDIFEAFDAVSGGLKEAKSGQQMDIMGALAPVINLLPTSVLADLAKTAAATVDFTVSNVRGANFEVYMAGAKMLGGYPMGPIAGTGFNLTTSSYNGKMQMGLVADAGAIDDPAELRDLIREAYEKFIAG